MRKKLKIINRYKQYKNIYIKNYVRMSSIVSKTSKRINRTPTKDAEINNASSSSNTATTTINLRGSVSPEYIVRSLVNTKTKKIKKNKLSFSDKSKLWEIFDNDKKKIECSSSCIEETPPTECVFSLDKETELCSVCNKVLIITEEGFPTCSNTDCGVIYTKTLDYSPEWRYYGADDRNANDPTRCGNPINPLLMESSFSCKILCDGNFNLLLLWHKMREYPKYLLTMR
jgi:exopolysaccharide biosynthesis protein